MKEITTIMLILIAVIGIISIIIVKLYYKDKEKYEEQDNLQEFINRNQINSSRKIRKSSPIAEKRHEFSEAQIYANTINSKPNNNSLFEDYYKEPINQNKNTTTLLRERVKQMEDSEKAKIVATANQKQNTINQDNKSHKQVTPTKTVKTEKQATQKVPMTNKQKEFLSKDSKKLVVEDTGENVKVVKSIKSNVETEKKTETKPVQTKEIAKEKVGIKKPTQETQKPIEKAQPTQETQKPIEKAQPIEELKPQINTSQKNDSKQTINTKIENKISKIGEKIYNKTNETENETYNSHNNLSNDLIQDAISSIKNFRKSTPQAEVKENKKITEEMPEDYIQNFGDGIEYIGDTITITPIREEEPNDLAYNQPNKDVDKIYKEINKESYNKTIDPELDKSYEKVTDETSEKDANIYTKEDYIETENKIKEEKLREENTKKILDLKKTKNESIAKESKDSKSKESESNLETKTKTQKVIKKDVKPESAASKKVLRRTAPMNKKEEPEDKKQKKLTIHKYRDDAEEVYINGTLVELKVGQTIMFDINNETYSSRILKIKPGKVGVKYRFKKVWIPSNNVKKIL